MSTQVFSPASQQPFPIVRTKASYQEIDEVVKRSILDPVLFAKNMLQVELWGKQKDILHSIQKNRKTAAKACHSSGKTFLAACATLWWLARYPESTVITTAPTDRQVVGVMWAEIHTLLRKSRYPFPEPTTQELYMASDRRAFGFTTSVSKGDEGTKLQGFHNSKVLIILDEAPGVEGKIWNAVEGLLASGDTRLLAIGNPTISSGPFFDAFGVNREGWATHTINAFDTPNLEGLTLDSLMKMSDDELGQNKVPYLISRHWVKDRLREWGPTHPLFISRVLGEFASQSPDSLFSLEWLEKAKIRTLPVGNKKLYAGLDVAGPGEDETCLVIRDGSTIIFQQSWPEADPRGEVVQALLPYRDRIEINVDVCGIGYYLARHLEDLKFVVSDVNVGDSSSDRERYANLKAELYWSLRMRAESGDLAGINDETTISQLAGIRYKVNARGQIYIESKDDARKRGVKSPDRAEAYMLCFAPSFQHGLFGYWEELSKSNIPSDLTLDEAQKRDAGFTDKVTSALEPFGPVERPKTLDSIVSSTKFACTGCGNENLATYSEGAWRCNCCGASGRKKEEVLV